MFIYLLRNKRTGKEYVGKTVVSLRARLYEHKARAKSGAPYPLCEAIRQDGVDAFEMTLLAQASSHEELWRLEQQFIEERNTVHPNGYNIVRGGRGNYGWKMPDATRQKIAAKRVGRAPWNKGRVMSESYRQKSSAGQRKRADRERAAGIGRTTWNKGVRATDETRQRLRDAKRQYFQQPEAHEKWSTVAKRNQAAMSPEAKAARNQKLADRKRTWWASLTPDQRAAHIDKMKSGHVAA